MKWLPHISKKFFLIVLIFFTLILYIFYSFNSCLISDLNNAIRKHRLHSLLGTYSDPRTSYNKAVNKFASLLGIEVEDGAPKYRLLKQQALKPTKRLPDALIIGVKKCGTRALLEFIRLHPDVRAAGSEIHFFDKYYHKGFEWYRQRMPPTLDGQLTMEKTPSYWVTRSAPRRVYAMNAAVKLLAVVRDPVTRAVSDYTQAASKKPSMPKFEQLAFVNSSAHFFSSSSQLASPMDVPWSVVDTTWPPVRLGVYARSLRRWLRRFPRSRLLLVSGERLVLDPAAEMARVQDFLGLKRVITEKHFYFNTTKGFPCLLKSEGRSTPHCLGKTKGRNHPYIAPEAIERLRDFYRPFNERFYELSGINFGWP